MYRPPSFNFLAFHFCEFQRGSIPKQDRPKGNQLSDLAQLRQLGGIAVIRLHAAF